MTYHGIPRDSSNGWGVLIAMAKNTIRYISRISLLAKHTRRARAINAAGRSRDHIRKELGSDKVFDIIGRLFEGRSLREFMEEAVTERGVVAAEAIGALYNHEKRAQNSKREENRIYGETGDVAAELPRLREDLRREVYRRLLPGDVRRFIERDLHRASG